MKDVNTEGVKMNNKCHKSYADNGANKHIMTLCVNKHLYSVPYYKHFDTLCH
jgi:hypothetical protein